jgi:hypothetical protein
MSPYKHDRGRETPIQCTAAHNTAAKLEGQQWLWHRHTQSAGWHLTQVCHTSQWKYLPAKSYSNIYSVLFYHTSMNFIINLLKPKWNYMNQLLYQISKLVFCIHGFSMILGVYSAHFFIQHYRVMVWSCFLRDTDRILNSLVWRASASKGLITMIVNESVWIRCTYPHVPDYIIIGYVYDITAKPRIDWILFN